ncbi:uncharacterized protein LOC122866728 [Siniperca chuatsi]|uniref:uncharacterized protein LOC122866728 n=1 Tax=Siniperca chuatsi TaxID=119488 RepID=UPI001CE17025|nr:uncharacterized protein LOC122866728 [Siniperca chuatsi]
MKILAAPKRGLQQENCSSKLNFPRPREGKMTKYTAEYVTEPTDLLFNEVIHDPSPFVAEMNAVAVPGFLCSQYERPEKSDAITSHVSRFRYPGGQQSAGVSSGLPPSPSSWSSARGHSGIQPGPSSWTADVTGSTRLQAPGRPPDTPDPDQLPGSACPLGTGRSVGGRGGLSALGSWPWRGVSVRSR